MYNLIFDLNFLHEIFGLYTRFCVFFNLNKFTMISKFYFRVVTLIVTLSLSSAFTFQLWAMPAKPQLIKVAQADGSTLSVRLNGDEHFSWRTTEEGYTVVEKEGFYYYANYQNGSLTASQERVSIKGRKMNPSAAIQKVNMSQIASSAATLSRVQRASNDNALGTNFPTEGTVKSAVILVEYTDVEFTVSDPKQAFTNQLNQEGYSVEGAVGSARDYFSANSGGKFNGQFDVYGPYKLSQPQRYYGGNNPVVGGDMRGPEMIEEAVELAHADGVDFSQYDLNDDGVIDNVFVYYAGHNEAEGGSTNCIWPHKWEVASKPIFDGKQLFGYACTSELRGSGVGEPIISGVGTFCHEFGHVLGLADHYDTTGEVDGMSYGLGNYDIMTTGGYNNDGNTPPLYNALERMMLGWSDPVELDKVEDITLAPIIEGKVYKMSTEVEGEYFLLENRNRQSSVWDEYIPGEGLLITHVDRSAPYVADWRYNYPNGDASHECFKLLVAGNVAVDYYNNWEKAPYPYKDQWHAANDNDEWSPNSRPRSESWAGKLLPYEVNSIARDGQNITFKVEEAVLNSLSGTVKDSSGNYVGGAELDLTTTSGTLSFSGVTDDSGVMKFESTIIPDGSYTLTVSAEGYTTYTKTFDLVQGINIDVTLYSEAQGSMHEIKHHDGVFDHALGSPYQMRPMVIFKANDLKKYIGCSLKEIRLYAAAPFEGQVIIQKGLYGGGWSPGPMSVTEADLGWRTIDFSGLESGGKDITIEPATDYYVKVMVMTATDANPAIGMDASTDRDLYPLSSMLDIQGASAQTVYENCGIDGNLMISMGLSQESLYVTPTGFNTNPAYDEGVNISVNENFPLVWGVIPANGNPACDWTSSDEKIVSVSGNGTLFGRGAGSAVVTGTSVLDPSVKMVYTVNVGSHEARAKGRVVDIHEREGVAGIELKFYQLETQPAVDTPEASAIAALRAPSTSELADVNVASFNTSVVDADTYLTATTDSEGNYSVEGMVAGSKYMIVIEQDIYTDPWSSYSQPTMHPMVAYDAESPETTINDLGDLILFDNNLYGADVFKYYEGTPELQSVGNLKAPTLYAIRIPASELTDRIGDAITNAEAYTYNMRDPYMEIVVFAKGEDGKIVLQGGTAYGEVATTASSGQLTFEFINQDPIIIRPKTDYYLGVKMIGEIGAQTSVNGAHDGYSNLVWSESKGDFISINELGYEGSYDWQMSIFTRDRAIDPITSITISPADPTVEPCVGREYSLVSSVAPSTATYSDVTWSSSNEEIATIDEFGNVTFLKAGNVTFIATSVEYPDVHGTYDVTVALKQGLEGVVVDSDSRLVSGAKLLFYPVVHASSSEAAMQRGVYTRSSEAVASASTNVEGSFYVDLAEGTYEVVATNRGLMDYEGLVTISYGLNHERIVMYQYIDTMSDFMSFTDSKINSSVGDMGYNFTAYTIWEAEDLAEHVGEKITRMKATIAGAATIRFVIFAPEVDEYIYCSNDIKVADGSVAMLVHDIPVESCVEIEANKDYCIGYEVAEYAENLAPAILSNSDPVVSGKSDCIIYRNEVTTLTELSQGETMGSWILGFYLQDEEQQKGVNLSVGQRDASLSWSPAQYDVFRVTYSTEGGEPIVADKITDCQFDILCLEPSTTYSVKVEGFNSSDSYTELVSTSFTTLEEKTTIPMIQLHAYDGYKAGETLRLQTINTESSDDVEWFVNSVELPRNTIVLEVGKHKIQCRVKRGSKSFVTTRYIVVE